MKYECDVIRDLMPLCAEGMASEASERTMQAHLAECKDCAAEWESYKDGSVPFPETEVPEETKQYAKTAKRVKRKHIRLLAVAVLTTVIVLVGIMAVNTFVIAGGRFTAHEAARTGLKKNRFTGNVEIIDTFFPADNTERICIAHYTDPETNKERLLSTYTFRAGICWFLGGIVGDIEIPAEKGVYAVTHPLRFSFYDCYYYYATDPAVQEITLTCGDDTYSFQLAQDADPICQIYLEHRYRTIVDETVTGTACDADGNVLYTLQGETWVAE
ncbi:MAG: zf-HC2 domain-containing protein [Oscillospiraceae bacterium]|nr:zf-HC2 domain-containing protein [Oscillospiraceae bacterium]